MYLMLATELSTVEVSLSGGNGFKGIKESWSTAEAWHYERPEKLVVMVQPQLQKKS